MHAVFGRSEAGVRVVEVAPGGPAARAGLAEGDRLLSIDGISVTGLPAAEVQKRLSGEVGSIAVLTVDRAGKTVEVRVERAPYQPAK